MSEYTIGIQRKVTKIETATVEIEIDEYDFDDYDISHNGQEVTITKTATVDVRTIADQASSENIWEEQGIDSEDDLEIMEAY